MIYNDTTAAIGHKNSSKEAFRWIFIQYAKFRTPDLAQIRSSEFMKSENTLIKLLSFVAAICILVCVFGFVSLVSLTCEERRKSIAIHKINGASPGNILSIFTKEYALLLLTGAAIAFPASFFIMKRWLEQYVIQTSISAWVYVSILFVMALMIVFCVGWKVFKASIENPVEAIKKVIRMFVKKKIKRTFAASFIPILSCHSLAQVCYFLSM